VAINLNFFLIVISVFVDISILTMLKPQKSFKNKTSHFINYNRKTGHLWLYSLRSGTVLNIRNLFELSPEVDDIEFSR
jgi:hypothetical protein